MLDASALALLAVGTGVKLLLWPAYHSTDFEVHRNWLAITASLPVGRWYYEDRSEWTLDYPPLFAAFEWVLSLAARLWDPRIIDIDNLGYAAASCVAFQRLSVMVSELVLVMALRRVVRIAGSTVQSRVAAALVFLSPGFLFVDHVHFQYNGFLLGILVYSLAFALEGRDLLAGTTFAVLLCCKHIFMYIAPAYFLYLLRHYCVVTSGRRRRLDIGASVLRLAALGSVVVAVFAVAFGPFVAMGHMRQVLARLFPFKRGLCHAFWAPNFWALYTFTDRVLAIASRFAPHLITADTSQLSSSTRGRVGDTRFAVLPDVPPLATFAATLVAMAPACVVLMRRKLDAVHFVQAVVLCAYASFMFGWHVHEKAIILVLVPLGLLVAMSPSRYVLRMHAVLSVAGFYGLLPLLYGAQELPLKAAILLIWTLCSLSLLRADGAPAWSCLARIERLYIAGHVPLFVLTELVPGVFGRLQFMPLALVSVYTALGVGYSWFGLARAFCRL
ncbi:glycosyl transferase [Coemansia sp. RSA 2705]|nr:glycosyl transferase [Coemansia sp. RSA 2705]